MSDPRSGSAQWARRCRCPQPTDSLTTKLGIEPSNNNRPFVCCLDCQQLSQQVRKKNKVNYAFPKWRPTLAAVVRAHQGLSRKHYRTHCRT